MNHRNGGEEDACAWLPTVASFPDDASNNNHNSDDPYPSVVATGSNISFFDTASAGGDGGGQEEEDRMLFHAAPNSNRTCSTVSSTQEGMGRMSTTPTGELVIDGNLQHHNEFAAAPGRDSRPPSSMSGTDFFVDRPPSRVGVGGAPPAANNSNGNTNTAMSYSSADYEPPPPQQRQPPLPQQQQRSPYHHPQRQLHQPEAQPRPIHQQQPFQLYPPAAPGSQQHHQYRSPPPHPQHHHQHPQHHHAPPQSQDGPQNLHPSHHRQYVRVPPHHQQQHHHHLMQQDQHSHGHPYNSQNQFFQHFYGSEDHAPPMHHHQNRQQPPTHQQSSYDRRNMAYVTQSYGPQPPPSGGNDFRYEHGHNNPGHVENSNGSYQPAPTCTHQNPAIRNELPITRFSFSDNQLPKSLRKKQPTKHHNQAKGEAKNHEPFHAVGPGRKPSPRHFSFANVNSSPTNKNDCRMTPSPIPMPPPRPQLPNHGSSNPHHSQHPVKQTETIIGSRPPAPPAPVPSHAAIQDGPLRNRQNLMQGEAFQPVKSSPKAAAPSATSATLLVSTTTATINNPRMPRKLPLVKVDTVPPGPSSVPENYPRRLALLHDHGKLNALHCFIRSELLEVFVVPPIVQSGAMAGRVGLRCVYCAQERERTGRIDSNEAPMAIFYPKAVAEIYRLVTSWQRCHVRKCRTIPTALRTKWDSLRTNDKSRGKTVYWTESAVDLGLINIASKVGGIRFRDDLNGNAAADDKGGDKKVSAAAVPT